MEMFGRNPVRAGDGLGLVACQHQRPKALQAVPRLLPTAQFRELAFNGAGNRVEQGLMPGYENAGSGRVLRLGDQVGRHELEPPAERVARTAWARLFAERPELPRPPGFAV